MVWSLRLLAIGLIVAGLWLVSLGPQPASTGSQSDNGDVRGWLLVCLGALYFVLDYRLKLRADARADRAERRDVEAHRRKMDDIG